MREKFDKFISTLNEFDLKYLEKEHLNGLDYKGLDEHLFNLWKVKNGR